MKHAESHLQRNCITWFRLQYPKYAKLMFAIPNGGKRNAREAGIMKAEGVTAGVSDLLLLISNKKYSSLCIEMKNEKGKQTKLQKQWQEVAEKHGNKYEVCRSLDSFRETVTEYLNNI